MLYTYYYAIYLPLYYIIYIGGAKQLCIQNPTMFSLAISNYDSSVYVKCDRIHPTTGLELTNNTATNTHTNNNIISKNTMLTDSALNAIPIISNIVYGNNTSLVKSSASSTVSLPIPITNNTITTTHTATSIVQTQPPIEEKSFFSTPEYARHTSSSTSSVSVSVPNHLAPMSGYGSSMHNSHLTGQQAIPTNPHMLSPLRMLARQPKGSTTTNNTNNSQNLPPNPSHSSNSTLHSHSLSHPSSIFNSTGLSFPDLSYLDLSHTPLTAMSNPMSMLPSHNSSTSLHSSTHPTHPTHLLHHSQHLPLPQQQQQQQQQAHNNILIPATNSESFDSIRLKLAQEIYIFIVQNSKSQGKKIW